MNSDASRTVDRDIIHFQELVILIRRNAAIALLVSTLCAGLGYGVTQLLTPRYASRAVLSIQAAYFQIPLVGDLVATANDSTEYRAQRESLMRFALNNEFLDRLGDRHGWFQYPTTERPHVVERDLFLKSIEYFPIGSNSYQITAHGRTAEMAHDIIQEVLQQMTTTLISERLGKLIRARSAIQASLDTLKLEIAQGRILARQPGDESGSSLEVRETLPIAEARLRALEQRFTANHPQVVQQRSRLEQLRRESREMDSMARKIGPIGSSESSTGGSRRALQELHDDLVKKFNYLNIVIHMEKSTGNYPYISIIERPDIPAAPAFPKKRIFAVGGAIGGLLLSLFIITVRELKRGTFSSPRIAADIFEAPFLGSLPPWEFAEGSRALPAPSVQTPVPAGRVG